MQLGFAFWGSKTLLSAIELGLFTELARGAKDEKTLTQKLGLHRRSARDFFDALVALGMLKRTGTRYANTPATATFLDRTRPSYIGGMLEMANTRLYGFWGRSPTACAPGNRRMRSRPAATSSGLSMQTRKGWRGSSRP
ncbi:MAG: methyltransferase dimerization domain-containing protein [Nitrospiraceae bacterium]